MTNSRFEIDNLVPNIGPVPEDLQGVIITDCSDENARIRQQVRFNSLFGVSPDYVGVAPSDDPGLEAGGHLVDVLDSLRVPSGFESNPAVVLVNVAPRGDDVRKKWDNGTPFCYLKIGNTHVLSTYEGRALSLVRKLKLADKVQLLDIPEVTASLVDDILLPQEAEQINNSQFRSKDFLPLAARLIVGQVDLPSETLTIEPHDRVANRAWYVDNFGNVKTTILPGEYFVEGKTEVVGYGDEARCYRRLADVPTGELALITGSSGYGDRRWAELVVQRGSAAERTGLGVGRAVLKGAVFNSPVEPVD